MSETAVPRQPGNLTGDPDLDNWLRALDTYRTTGVVPPGYEPFNNPDLPIMPIGNERTFMDKYGWLIMASLPAAGLVGGQLAGVSGTGGGASATAAAGAGTQQMIPGLEAAAGGGGSSALGISGLSYGDLARVGLNVAGNYLSNSGNRTQRRQSFNNTTGVQDITTPQNSLYGYLSAIYRLGEGLQGEPPAHTSAVVAPPPAPVTIPGLNFQIGGGFGHDPALGNPALLTAPDHAEDAFKFDPFQGQAQRQFGQTGGSTAPAPVRRRQVGGQ